MRHMLCLVTYICCLSVLLTGCSPWLSRGNQAGSATPEEAVRRSVLVGTNLPPDTVQSFKVHGVRPWEQGSIVLYSLANQRNPEDELFYYHFVEQRKEGWYATYGKGFSAGMFQKQRFISFRADGIDIAGGQYLVIFGHVDAPAAAVEVSLLDQHVLQDTATRNTFFVILPQTARPHELHVLNQHGSVIERVDLSPQLTGGSRTAVTDYE